MKPPVVLIEMIVALYSLIGLIVVDALCAMPRTRFTAAVKRDQTGAADHLCERSESNDQTDRV